MTKIDFKNTQFRLDIKRIEVSVTAEGTPKAICQPVLTPEYLEERYPLNVGNGALIFFAHIGASEHNEFPNGKPKTKAEYLKEVQDIAISKGGKCLATEWLGERAKMEFECAHGHRWPSKAWGIKNGRWCPICSYNDKKLTLESIQALAVEKGGKCLSEKYINSRTKMEFECADGHRFERIPKDITRGRWCQDCGMNKKLTIELFQAIAIERGGKCLSTEYIDRVTNLEFECKDEHRWNAMPFHIKNGGWCPVCAGTQKLTLEYMHELAASRGGEFLSPEYKNKQTPHLWRCGEGHEWPASPSNIMYRNGWCPYCSIYTSQERCRSVFEILTGKKFRQLLL